jgi:hypothetical protein
MARKALHGDLCRICGERPRVQYKSGLSAYCRECTNAAQRAKRKGGGGAAPAPAVATAPVTPGVFLDEQPVTHRRASSFRPEWRNPQPVTPEAQRVAARLAAAPITRVIEALTIAYTWR